MFWLLQKVGLRMRRMEFARIFLNRIKQHTVSFCSLLTNTQQASWRPQVASSITTGSLIQALRADWLAGKRATRPQNVIFHSYTSRHVNIVWPTKCLAAAMVCLALSSSAQLTLELHFRRHGKAERKHGCNVSSSDDGSCVPS